MNPIYHIYLKKNPIHPNKKMKNKILALAVVLIQLFILAPVVNAQVPGEKRMLMVSAYYSPLPNQTFYMRGSYEADIRLNGRGTNGADGTEVYTGLLAAPRTYPFGTRISIPGLGVGEVHDRGGAIRALANYDRIDVWMGYGEDGLSRALNWGMRLVEGEVFWQAHQIQPGLSFNWISPELPASTLNRLQTKTLINPQAFNQTITQTSPKTSIRELQEALRLFGYYHGEVSGVYNDETQEAVLTFQIDEGVIPDPTAVGAGHFGPKTRLALQSKSENFNSHIIKEQERLRNNIKSITAGLGKNAEGEEVYHVQQMLWELGYYNGELSGFYNVDTISAVFEFQRDYGVVQNDWDTGAGYFGKKTHEALVSAVNEKMRRLAYYPAEMQVWVPAKVDLPVLSQLDLKTELTEKKALYFDPVLAEEAVKGKAFLIDFSLNAQGKDVFALQQILIDHGYLSGSLKTGYFGHQTQKALIQFQIDQGIILNSGSAGAGRVGPFTRMALNAL